MSTRKLVFTILYLVIGLVAVDHNHSPFWMECLLLAVVVWLGFALVGRILA